MLRRDWKIISLGVIALAASTATVVTYRRISVLEDRLGCAATWLDKAKALHAAQMKQPETFTNDEMRKLMDSVDAAYYCATRDPYLGHPPGSGAFGQYGVLPQK